MVWEIFPRAVPLGKREFLVADFGFEAPAEERSHVGITSGQSTLATGGSKCLFGDLTERDAMHVDDARQRTHQEFCFDPSCEMKGIYRQLGL